MIRLLSTLFLLPAALSFTAPAQFTLRTTTHLHSSISPPSDTLPYDISLEQYKALASWFTSSSQQSYISPKFSIQPSPSSGYGAFASSPISSGELLLSIPRSSCITLDNAFNDADIGEKLRKLRREAGPGSDTVCIAAYIAKQYLVLQEYKSQVELVEEGSLMDGAAKRRLENVKFKEYLESLPWKAGVNGQDHVLFWSEEDVEELLVGSLAYEDAVEIRNSVKYATKILNGIIGPTINKARGIEEPSDQSTFRLPWQQPPPEKQEQTIEGLEEAIRGAFVICLSRGFARIFKNSHTNNSNNEETEECLIPFLDILQHSNNPNCSDENSSTLDNVIEIRASRDIQAGEELFNQYKDEEDANMPYHKFFTRFGFVPGVVEDVVDLVRRRSPIFFARKESV